MGVEAVVRVWGFITLSFSNTNNGSSSLHLTSERYSTEALLLTPPTAPVSSLTSFMDSVSPVAVIVPCPESPAIDHEWGSWSIICFHSSSWEGAKVAGKVLHPNPLPPLEWTCLLLRLPVQLLSKPCTPCKKSHFLGEHCMVRVVCSIPLVWPSMSFLFIPFSIVIFSASRVASSALW